MPVYRINVSWTEVGEYFVEAPSLAAAIEAVEGNDNDRFPLSEADGLYLDDSLAVDKETSKEVFDIQPENIISLDAN
jgi:hypothetical protein